MLLQPPSSPAVRSGSARENISAGNVKPRSPSYKCQQLSPAGSLCPANLRTRAKSNAGICSYGHKSWAGQQRNCSHRCAQWGPAEAPWAEESQPNPKSYHNHRAPCFLWQRGKHSSSLLGAEASSPSPGSPHISDHGHRLFFFLSTWGRGCSPPPEADTCATQLSPGMLQREGGLDTSADMVILISPSTPARDAR